MTTDHVDSADKKFAGHALVDSPKHTVILDGEVFPYHLAEPPRAEMRDGVFVVHLPVIVCDSLHVVDEDGATASFAAQRLGSGTADD